MDIEEYYLEFNFSDKKVYIMKEHRFALFCWLKAYKEKLTVDKTPLFHIDKHTDFCFDEKNLQNSKNLLILGESEASNLIINDLRKDNAEFIVNSMYSNLISDVICVHFQTGSDYGKYKESDYSTTDKYYFNDGKKEHNFYLFESENLTNLIGYQSLIGDSCIHQDTNSLFNDSENIILDIDLDFFTYRNEEIYSKNKKDIKNQLNSKSFRQILNKSRIITIALEPECCGGIDQCLEILDLFNEEIFKPNELDIYEKVKQKFLD